MKPSRASLLAIGLLAIVVGCAPTDETDEPPRIDPPQIVEVTESLTFFESELVGKWSRFHSYDGSTDYWIFNSDRTACKFEISDSGSRKDDDSYVYWRLDPVEGEENVFKLVTQATPNSQLHFREHEYHYGPDQLWSGGYSNLKMFRSNTSRDCNG